jgi:hypothetical protein
MEAGLMFGNSKQLPITLALGGCRPAIMPYNARSSDKNVYLNVRPRLVEQLGMIERLNYSKYFVTLI